jgi:hypothetical protein
MHRPILLLCILFPVIVTATPTPVSETKRLESLCRIWGFLKYYHPHVARGQRNWDQELIEKIPQVLAAQDKEALNEIYAAWLEALGKVRRCNNCSVHQLVQAPPAPDFSWLQDTSVFSPAVSARLFQRGLLTFATIPTGAGIITMKEDTAFSACKHPIVTKKRIAIHGTHRKSTGYWRCSGIGM